MSDELRQALIDEVTGVGDSTADTILQVLEEHDDVTLGEVDGPTLDGRLLVKAVENAREGNNRQTAMYLRRANE